MRKATWGGLAVGPLHLPAHQEVELLVRAPHLDVRTDGHGVVGLGEGVEELVQGDGDALLVALLEVLPLQHLGHGHEGGEAHHLLEGEAFQPLGVVAELKEVGLLPEDLPRLLHVGPGVFPGFLEGQGRPGLAPPRGIPDHAREVPDDEHHLVPKLLELAHLPQDHRMPQVQVGPGGVGSQLDHQRTALL